ncbi:beta propeller repeat protein [Alicyclobacillus mengziensis]|uniref:Photosynthesis system II assembly factor Ycf48/Hcf136-like domain-containing protein n=1 Tax=Alicyclobacillus mengziensis TaxID=2931921 RepID=A0A9X7W2C5_9BACL|nr:hypothetical protein [Alicyclobacillus mengziensis]QSO49207.1 hypothetical protein JZ786_09965 [Alicyclobacillus mengziensis]
MKSIKKCVTAGVVLSTVGILAGCGSANITTGGQPSTNTINPTVANATTNTTTNLTANSTTNSVTNTAVGMNTTPAAGVQTNSPNHDSISVTIRGTASLMHSSTSHFETTLLSSYANTIWFVAQRNQIRELWKMNGSKLTRLTLPAHEIPRQFHFVNRSVGWIVTDSNTIFQTSDGGTSWMKVALPLQSMPWVQNISYDSVGGHTWLLASGPQAQYQSEKMLFEKKMRNQWTLESESHAYITPTSSWKSMLRPEIPVPGDYPSIHFVTPELGFMTTDTAGGPDFLLRTIDAGRTWEPDNVNGLLPSTWGGGVTMSPMSWDGENGWVVVQGMNGQYLLKYQSQNWRLLGKIPASLSSQDLVYFYDSSHGVMSFQRGKSYYIAVTADGGYQWSAWKLPHKIVKSADGPILSLREFNNTIWFTRGGTLYKSSNQGRSWTAIS